MDTNRLRATFDPNCNPPRAFLTDGLSVPFSIVFRWFLFWGWWELKHWVIGPHGRMKQTVAARDRCPDKLIVLADELYTERTRQAIEDERDRMRNAEAQFRYWQSEGEDL